MKKNIFLIIFVRLSLGNVSLALGNISEEIRECGGVSTVIDSILWIIISYIIGYIILYIINYLRILFFHGNENILKRANNVTFYSVKKFVTLFVISVLFVLPFAVIPVAILLCIASAIISYFTDITYGSHIDDFLVIFFYVYLAISLIYCLFKSSVSIDISKY